MRSFVCEPMQTGACTSPATRPTSCPRRERRASTSPSTTCACSPRRSSSDRAGARRAARVFGDVPAPGLALRALLVVDDEQLAPRGERVRPQAAALPAEALTTSRRPRPRSPATSGSSRLSCSHRAPRRRAGRRPKVAHAFLEPPSAKVSGPPEEDPLAAVAAAVVVPVPGRRGAAGHAGARACGGSRRSSGRGRVAGRERNELHGEAVRLRLVRDPVGVERLVQRDGEPEGPPRSARVSRSPWIHSQTSGARCNQRGCLPSQAGDRRVALVQDEVALRATASKSGSVQHPIASVRGRPSSFIVS